MTINPFLAGVLSTLFFELCAVVLYAVIKNISNKEKKNGKKE